MSAHDIVDRALDYPFRLPEESYILLEGHTYPMVKFSLKPLGETILRSHGERLRLRQRLPVADTLDERHFLPILASGSNAAPSQLRRKFADRLGSLIIPVLRTRVLDICSVYSAHLAPYGSIPATLHWLEGARTDLFCVFIPKDLIGELHTTEALNVSYGFYEVRSPRISMTGCDVVTYYSYISLWGNLSIDGAPIRLPAFQYEGPHIKALTELQIFRRILPVICPDMGIHDFIERVVRDREFRARYSQILNENFSIDNKSEHFHRVE